MRNVRRAQPLLWLGPTLLLIAAVIVYPAFEMVRASFQDISRIGIASGYKGLENYRDLLGEEALPTVFVNTVLWVVVVVGATIVVSLAMAQFLNKRFAGRRFVRWALIVPWAASLVMTSTVWRYIYEYDYGPLNRLLMDLGIINGPVDWYKDNNTAFWCLVFVGIVVSIPFTTYVFLAGLQTVPHEVYEAAAIDGAGPLQTYWQVTFPLLRPQLVVAIVLNTIYVFNSFPIIWVITGKIPGQETDTTVTYMYELAFQSAAGADEAAALGVLNVLFLLVLVLFYVRRTQFGESGEASIRVGSGGPGVLARIRSAASDALAPVGRSLAEVLRPVAAAVGRGWRPVRRAGLPLVGLVAVVFFLAPYAVMLIGSLKSTRELAASPATYFPAQPAWSNFVDVWSRIPLWDYLRASLVIALFATVIVLLVALPAAYFTARHQFAGRRVFLTLVLVTQMFAPVALVVGLYREFVVADALLKNINPEWGAVNTYWTIILINSAFNLAFAIWILNGYFASIPKDIEEAAMIDGLSRFRAMVQVILPLAKPGIVTAVIFTFIQVWNEFVVALTLFNDPTRNRQTLTVGINQFIGQYDVNYQYLFIVSLIGIVPVVVLFALIERYLVSGLTAGSVK